MEFFSLIVAEINLIALIMLINAILKILIMKIKNEVNKVKTRKLIDLIQRVEREPEPKFLWNGIMEGSHGLIVGHPKTGKTTFAENLAILDRAGKVNHLQRMKVSIAK
ncbi:hypothetical protein [Mariniflexile maritimum]|uniref:hypothetical protein n=1 Tax=Mariniflexile maritimum TaxID=2682493 RepID=UPI0012F68141|nr:hypothetical protein [Mariniflexile maritimum]